MNGKLYHFYIESGFKPGAPRAATAEIDSECCLRWECDGCREVVDMRYRPVQRDGQYVAIAECPNCGAEVEF